MSRAGGACLDGEPLTGEGGATEAVLDLGPPQQRFQPVERAQRVGPRLLAAKKKQPPAQIRWG